MALPRFDKNASEEELLELQAQARRASELMKALSHETRLLILCLLTEKEMSVSELEEIIGLSQAAVSQQLARLRLERLVSTRRDGRQIYYQIVDKEVNTIVESLYDLFCKPVRE
ncbi:MAG: ArsR/SmtB family transcription factor [Granulosicoccus sp.]